MGRPTCEWCRKLAPALQEAVTSLSIDIYYVDTSNSDSNYKLASFRERYSIDSVPAVIFFTDNRKPNRLDIELDAEDLDRHLRERLSYHTTREACP